MNLGLVDPEIELVPAREEASGNWGYLDASTGGWAITPAFSTASSFSKDGYAVASVNQKYGVIDKTGNWIIPAQYDNIFG
jgi:hypothetical protein